MSRFTLLPLLFLLTGPWGLAFAPDALAGTVSGDTYRARVEVDGTQVANVQGVAGSGTLDLCAPVSSSCAAGSSYTVLWLDDDSVNVVWNEAASPNPARVAIHLEGIDFVGSGGQPEGILGVTESFASGPASNRLDLVYTGNAITLDYAALAPGEAAASQNAEFDVLTHSSLIDSVLFRQIEGGTEILAKTLVRAAGITYDAEAEEFTPTMVEWFDDLTVEYDWRTSGDPSLVFEISGIEVRNIAGQTGTFDGAVLRPPVGSPAVPAPAVTTTADAVTLTYAPLTGPQLADGDDRVVELQTSVPLADTYSVTIVEDGSRLATAFSARQAPQFRFVDEYRLTWMSANSFEIDWFASGLTSGSWTIEFRTLTGPGGGAGVITDVIKGDSLLCVDPTLGFTDDSVTINYTGIAPGDSECGDARVITLVVPEPGLGLMLFAGIALLAGLQRSAGPRD